MRRQIRVHFSVPMSRAPHTELMSVAIGVSDNSVHDIQALGESYCLAVGLCFLYAEEES